VPSWAIALRLCGCQGPARALPAGPPIDGVAGDVQPKAEGSPEAWHVEGQIRDGVLGRGDASRRPHMPTSTAALRESPLSEGPRDLQDTISRPVGRSQMLLKTSVKLRIPMISFPSNTGARVTPAFAIKRMQYLMASPGETVTRGLLMIS